MEKNNRKIYAFQADKVYERITSFFQFSAKDDYLRWGKDDKTPLILFDLYKSVSEHQSAIDFTKGLIIQSGITSEEIDYWTANKLVRDYLILGCFAVEVKKLRGGGVKYFYCDVSNCRLDKKKEKIIYSEDFYKSTNKKLLHINISDGKSDGIFIFKNPNSNEVYPFPHYISAEMSLDTMKNISEYHNLNARCGFSPSVVINMNNGIPEEDIQRKIEKSIEEKFTGSKGQRFMLIFNDSKEQQVTVSRLTNDNLDQKFETLQKFIQNQIIIAHKLTSPQLIGVKAESQGFSKSEYEEALTIFKENVVSVYQKEIEYGLSQLLNKDVKFVEKEVKNGN